LSEEKTQANFIPLLERYRFVDERWAFAEGFEAGSLGDFLGGFVVHA
jgi:hypothetical protein